MGIDYEGFIKERMQKDPVTVRPDASFNEARVVIRDRGIRHLPVVDSHQRFVGLVTDTDIREAGPSDATTLSVNELHFLLGKLKVASFMTPREKVITITADTLIEEAAQLMRQHKIGCLPVVEGDRLIGLITETDVLDLFVDVFGLKAKGHRLTVGIEDKPGQMHAILGVIKDHNVNVSSIISPSFLVHGKRVAALRIQTEDYGPIVKELNEKGFEVLSVDHWTVKP